jgi:hypothetical protein
MKSINRKSITNYLILHPCFTFHKVEHKEEEERNPENIENPENTKKPENIENPENIK